MHGTLKHLPFAVYRTALAFTIVLGSLITWLGIPALWIWLAGQLYYDYPSIYLVAAGGCPLTMIIWGWALYRLNARYLELNPPPSDAPGTQRSAWLGSLSGGRRPQRRQASLLDVSMIVSVIIALTVMAVWFFAFAHAYGPLPD
jgi:hypothetical protein